MVVVERLRGLPAGASPSPGMLSLESGSGRYSVHDCDDPGSNSSAVTTGRDSGAGWS